MTRLAILAGAAAACAAALAQPTAKEMRVISTSHRFDALVERVERSVEKHGLGVVARASASRGAAARGVKIPGNAVIMVFRNDFAVRLLAADVAAGIEAPLRLYLTENPDGSATLSYRSPSAVFAPYRHPEVGKLARELDSLFERIARDAAGG